MTTFKTAFAKILLLIAVVFWFKLFSIIFNKEYLQSTEIFVHDMFIKPSIDLFQKPDQLLQLLKKLYVLAYSGF